jgi:hypothetical protein
MMIATITGNRQSEHRVSSDNDPAWKVANFTIQLHESGSSLSSYNELDNPEWHDFLLEDVGPLEIFERVRAPEVRPRC